MAEEELEDEFDDFDEDIAKAAEAEEAEQSDLNELGEANAGDEEEEVTAPFVPAKTAQSVPKKVLAPSKPAALPQQPVKRPAPTVAKQQSQVVQSHQQAPVGARVKSSGPRFTANDVKRQFYVTDHLTGAIYAAGDTVQDLLLTMLVDIKNDLEEIKQSL